MYKIWNNFKTALLLSLLMGLCLAIGYLLGGQAALLPALVVGGVLNFFAFFFSDKIALATMRARQISRQEDPMLWDTVQELTERAGLPMPRVYISPAPAPNAFATGRGPNAFS
jgi:heat shock protein HtpX